MPRRSISLRISPVARPHLTSPISSLVKATLAVGVLSMSLLPASTADPNVRSSISTQNESASIEPIETSVVDRWQPSFSPLGQTHQAQDNPLLRFDPLGVLDPHAEIRRCVNTFVSMLCAASENSWVKCKYSCEAYYVMLFNDPICEMLGISSVVTAMATRYARVRTGSGSVALTPEPSADVTAGIVDAAATWPKSGQRDTRFRFKLEDCSGREWTDRDFRDKEFVVVAFLGTECPLAKLYGVRLQQIRDEFDDVAVVGVNANTQDSLAEMAHYAEQHDISFPLLKDPKAEVADQFHAERTPEVFLLDGDRQVRYQGVIDDQYSVGRTRSSARQRYLRNAIDALRDGREVAIPRTESVGCFIGRIKHTPAKGEITYCKHIARIFQRRCVRCHREGELAPFSLRKYEDVIGWEDTIREVIEDARMPPWFASPQHGEFENDCRLSEEEKTQIYSWIENGMPEGDPRDLPSPVEFLSNWTIPDPDEILYMDDTPFRVPSEGTVDYQFYCVDPGWTEDKYISAAEARPGNRGVVHHILVYVLPPEQWKGKKILSAYAPGTPPTSLQNGVAIKVEAGSKLLFQLHYTTNGIAQNDRSSVGVKFLQKQHVRKLMETKQAFETRFRIPAGAAEHQVSAEYRVGRDELLLSMAPHLHTRGKSFEYVAEYPTGEREVLLSIPNYDFNWQLKYVLKEPKLLPRGTTIRCKATYDNSAGNTANPDPTRDVTWGDQTWEEMMVGFFDTVPPDTPTSTTTQTYSETKGTYSWKHFGATNSIVVHTQRQNSIACIYTEGTQRRMQGFSLRDGNIEFVVDTDQVVYEFKGVVSGNAIRGTVRYTFTTTGRTDTVPWNARKLCWETADGS